MRQNMLWETSLTFDPGSLNSSVQISFAPISGSSWSPNFNYTEKGCWRPQWFSWGEPKTSANLRTGGGGGCFALHRRCLILSNRAVLTQEAPKALTISGTALKALISPFSTANEERDWGRGERRREGEEEKKQREIKNRAGLRCERGGAVWGWLWGGVCCVFTIETN